MKWARESVRVGRDREREEGESGAKERVIVGQERVKMGHGSGERDREREWARKRERECTAAKESVLQGNRESGTREKEREWGICEKSKRESLFRDASWG